jgi:hypothetical protein
MTEMKHDLTMKVTDNTSALWVVCSCGYESAFYTIEGDGRDAKKAALDEAQIHLAPPRNPEDDEIEEPRVDEAPKDIG